MKRFTIILGFILMSTCISFSKEAVNINQLFAQVASSIESGMSARGLWAAAQIESHGNPNSTNGKYAGLINMGEAEFKKYGPPYGSRKDPLHNLIAASFYMQDLLKVLRVVLGRAPTEAELYLAIQQGRKGAPDLLTHPHERAVKVRGRGAILGNVPSDLKRQAERWTCAQFTAYWTVRFNEIMKRAEV